MKQKKLFRLAGFVLATGYISAPAQESPKPNLLFIIADDCTRNDLGCYGGQAHTPNIDALTQQGMRFTRFSQAAPMCSPTRQNIYTGLYPVKSGAYPNHAWVKPGVKCVVDYLKPLGYRVALAGKEHFGPPKSFPFEYISKNKLQFDKIGAFVKECAEQNQPFCLFVCSHEPHTPWNRGDPSAYPPDQIKLPPTFVDTPETRHDMSLYLAEVTVFDEEVGKCLQILKQNKIAKNTLTVVTSEQGNSFPFAKWTCYDAGLETAFIVRWPGQVKAGVTTDAMGEYTDVLPTFIEAAGGKPNSLLDGKSLLPVLTGKTNEHKKFVFGEMTTRGINGGSDHFGIRSVRSEQFKYIINFTPDAEFSCAATGGDVFHSWEAVAKTNAVAAAKVRRYVTRPPEELYDIIKDPYEQNNLAANPEYEEVKAELGNKLKSWMKQCGDDGEATEMQALEHQNEHRNKEKE